MPGGSSVDLHKAVELKELRTSVLLVTYAGEGYDSMINVIGMMGYRYQLSTWRNRLIYRFHPQPSILTREKRSKSIDQRSASDNERSTMRFRRRRLLVRFR